MYSDSADRPAATDDRPSTLRIPPREDEERSYEPGSRPRDDERPRSRDGERRPRDEEYERPRSRDGRSRDRRPRDDNRYYEWRRRDDDRYERSRRDDDRYYERRPRDDRGGYDRRRERDDRGYERDRGYDRRGDDRRYRSRSRGRDRRRQDHDDRAPREPVRKPARSRSRRDDRPPPRDEKPAPAAAPAPAAERSRSRSLSWSPPPAVRRQMAEFKAKKAREAETAKAGKDPMEKTGKFWDGFRWVEHTPASQLPSDPATRKERRLYVGNLPPTFDSEQLRIFLNEALRACGAIPAGVDEVVISSWVSPDHKFAFVEISTVEASTTALGLSGITCMGCQLKICHPNNYVVGALPGMGTALATLDQNGVAYAPGFGPDADPQQQEFMQAALAAMATGAPTQ